MKIVVISGFFNPLHGGHLDMVEAAAELGDKLVVIVNNDKQAVMKKGKIILDQGNRVRLISALRGVDDVLLSIDYDASVSKSLKEIANKYNNDKIVFANGGDRDSGRAIREAEVCSDLGIELVFGVGSADVIKRDSSSRINQATGHEIL